MSRMASSLSWLFRGWRVLPRSLCTIRCARCREGPVLQVGCGYPDTINGVLVLAPSLGAADWKAQPAQRLPARGR